MKIYGIDVSHHQGAINWQRTASELRRVNGGNNPGFALLRVGYSARHGKGGPVYRRAVLEQRCWLRKVRRTHGRVFLLL